MRVLWDRPQSTVGDIVEHMDGPSKPAYNSVLTILRILERKGYVSHEKEGRAFVYAALIGRQEARRGALTHLLSRFFDGSRELLVLDLLGHERIGEDELQRVRQLLEASQPERQHAQPAASSAGRGRR